GGAAAPAPAPAWLAQLIPAPAAALPGDAAPATIVLDNGLRLRYVRERGLRGFYLAGFITGWTGSDPAGKEGLGSATSQLIGAGGKHGRLRRLAAGAAADDLTVQVGQRIAAAGPAPRFHDTLAAIGDALSDPSFPSGALDFVRRRMRDAAKSRDADPDSVANALFDRQLVTADDPALRRPTPASIDGLSPRDVEAFAAAHLRPDATVLALVADLDPADVRREATAAFGGWRNPAGAPPAAQAAIRTWSPSRRVVVVPAQSEHLILGQPVPGTQDDRYPSLLLANEILGVGFDSRLLRALRFERGLALSATSKLIANPGRGILRIDTRVPAARAREAAALIKEEVARLTRDLVPAGTLARARAQLLAARSTAYEQPASLADSALEDEMAAAAGRRPPLARTADVTPERLRADMRTLLAPDRLAEVDTGPLH
ncbi:MAG: peptidase, partial [Candidatus Eremiobacteraeota bacterium]|nr:peptidase [Candidatus Eremiobacteraeota bacterium]